ADIGNDYRQFVAGTHGVEKVATDLLAGDVAGAQGGKRDFGDGDRHQSLLDGGRNSHLLLVAAVSFLRFRQAGVFHQRGSFARDGVHHVVTDAGKIARSVAGVQVEHAQNHRLGGSVRGAGGLYLGATQGYADHGAQIISN